MSRPIEPLFILSHERSGSTLLRYILDTHPSVCCPGQLYLGPLCQSLYTTAYYSIAQLQKNATESEKELIAIAEVRRTVSDLLGRYADEKGKSRWCEKTTLNINYLPIITKVFPDSKFICLYRNCLDVINSCISCSSWGFMPELMPYAQNHPGNFVAAMAESWFEKNQKLLAFEQEHQAQSFRLTYESLVSDPNSVLTSLFQFLGLEWDEQWLHKVFTNHHDHGDGDTRILFMEKISQASVGKGGRIPLSNLQEYLSKKINNMHDALGYQSLQTLHALKTSTADLAPQASENTGEQEPDLSLSFESKMTEVISSKHDELRTCDGVCKFVVPGIQGGTWLLDTTGKDISFQKGETNADDCSIATSYQTFLDILSGYINPVDAYEQKKLIVNGNIEAALRYGKLLFSR